MITDPVSNPNENRSTNIQEGMADSQLWSWNWKRNIVDDPNAPELYSQRAIWGFSLLLAPIFGAVLMAMNFKRIEKPRLILPIVTFGIAWYVLAIIMIPEQSRSSAVYLLNMLGGLVLVYFFWPRFLGKELKYRKRKILVPLIIGLVIGAIFLLAIIASH